MSNTSNILKFSAGQTIFAEGEEGHNMYFIVSGRVEIRSADNLIHSLGEGEIFGEMALIDQSPRSADAVAVADCELEEISERAFVFRIGEAPFFALKVMRTLASRLREANQGK